MRDPAGRGSSSSGDPFSSPDANPFAPPNVASRRAPSTVDRRDFSDLATKQLARGVADLQTISALGGLPIFVGCFCLVMLAMEFAGGLPVSRSLGPVGLAAGIVFSSLPTGILILRRKAGARPLAILIALIVFPLGIAAIGPLVRDNRLFGPNRIRRPEMRKMERELAYRRKYRIP